MCGMNIHGPSSCEQLSKSEESKELKPPGNLLPVLPAQALQTELKRDARVRLGYWRSEKKFLLTALAKKQKKERKKDGDQMFSI